MIIVRYSTVDGVDENKTFKHIGQARQYAHHWIGATPEVGRGYAVSGDGVGKITVDGATLKDLFPDVG